MARTIGVRELESRISSGSRERRHISVTERFVPEQDRSIDALTGVVQIKLADRHGQVVDVDLLKVKQGILFRRRCAHEALKLEVHEW